MSYSSNDILVFSYVYHCSRLVKLELAPPAAGPPKLGKMLLTFDSMLCCRRGVGIYTLRLFVVMKGEKSY